VLRVLLSGGIPCRARVALIVASLISLALTLAGCEPTPPAAPPPAAEAVAPATGTATASPEATATPALPTPEPTSTATPSPSHTATPSPEPEATPTTEAPVLRVRISPEAVYPGDVVTLTWEVEDGLGSVSVWSVEKWGSLTADLGPFPAGAGVAQLATNPDLRGRQYFSVCAAPYATANLSVTLLCPDVWLFPNPPQEGCPLWTLRTRIVAQRFERGWMLWTEADRRIYVLPEDLPWDVVEDVWQEGMPESDPSLVPPPGLQQPVRGFGLAWRTAEIWMYGQTTIHEALGWAEAPEYVVGEGFVQEAFTYGKHVLGGDRFVTGPEGNVLHLPQRLNRFTWSVWEGP